MPLPGLCVYPRVEQSFMLKLLFPRGLSPFVKLIASNPTELFQDSLASAKIFESPPLQANVNFKWNAYARWRYYIFLFFYLVHLGIFTAAISDTTKSRQLILTSMISSAILLLGWIRIAIISVVNEIATRAFRLPTTYLALFVNIAPLISGFLEYSNSDNAILAISRFFSLTFLWLGLIGLLCAFKKIGLFLIGKNGL